MARAGYSGSYGILVLVLGIGVGGLIIYKSFRMVMHLRDEPPPRFLNVGEKWTPQQRETEERLARAYWNRAVDVSRMFPYGSPLPDKPPDGFSVDTKTYPSAVDSAAAAKLRYWRNLKEVWYLPDAWKTSYEWHMDWLFRGTNF
jgi:hypothetical protein